MSVQGNVGGDDQSSASLKSTVPPENSPEVTGRRNGAERPPPENWRPEGDRAAGELGDVKSTVPPENWAALKSTVPPENWATD